MPHVNHEGAQQAPPPQSPPTRMTDDQQNDKKEIIRKKLQDAGQPQEWIEAWVEMPGRRKFSGCEQLGIGVSLLILAPAALGLMYSWEVLDALSTGKVYRARLDALVAKQASDCDGGISSEVQGLRICFILATLLLAFEILGWVATLETCLSTCDYPACCCIGRTAQTKQDVENQAASAASAGNGCIAQCLWWSLYWVLVKAYHLCCCCCLCGFIFTAIGRVVKAIFTHSMTLFKLVTWLWGLVSVAQVLLYACLLNKLLYWGLWCPSTQQPGTDWLQQVSLDFFLANPAATSYSPTTSQLALPFLFPPLPPLPPPLTSSLLLTTSPNPPPLPPTSLARLFAPPSTPPLPPPPSPPPAPPAPPPFPLPASPPFIPPTYNPAPYPSPPPPPPSPLQPPPLPPPPPSSRLPPQANPFQLIPGTGNPPLILPSSPLQPPPLPATPLPLTSLPPPSPPPPPAISAMSPPTAPRSSSPAPPPQLPRPSLCVADGLPWQMARAIFMSVLVALMSTASIMTKGATASIMTLSCPALKVIVAFFAYLLYTCALLAKPLAASLVFVQWQRLLIDKAEFCVFESLSLSVANLACSWLNSVLAVVFVVLIQNWVAVIICSLKSKPNQVTQAPAAVAGAKGAATTGQASTVQAAEADGGTPLPSTPGNTPPPSDSVWKGQQAILPLLFCLVWMFLSVAVFVLSYFTSKAAIAAGLDSRSPWLLYDISSAYAVLIASTVGFFVLVAYAHKTANGSAGSAKVVSADLGEAAPAQPQPNPAPASPTAAPAPASPTAASFTAAQAAPVAVPKSMQASLTTNVREAASEDNSEDYSEALLANRPKSRLRPIKGHYNHYRPALARTAVSHNSSYFPNAP